MRNPDLGAVLDAHEKNGGGRVRGIRHSAARLEDPSARLIAGAAPPGLYRDRDFRRGVALLGERGLAFDAFQFHFQLEELAGLARSAPDTTIVVNHLGAPIGFTPNPAPARSGLCRLGEEHRDAGRLPNVVMKLGGLASIVTGYDGHKRDRPPSSQEFVDERGAYFHHAIGCFGPERCMFESNFPVDSVSISYGVLWNAYKMIAMDYGTPARRALLARDGAPCLPNVAGAFPGQRGLANRPAASRRSRSISLHEYGSVPHSASNAGKVARPFEGVRIIDVSHVLAGPYCSYQLALLGADVIKIEPPTKGDIARNIGPEAELNARGLGLGFLGQNSNKRSLAHRSQDRGRQGDPVATDRHRRRLRREFPSGRDASTRLRRRQRCWHAGRISSTRR